MSDTVIKVENLGKRYLLTHLADKREQLFSSLLVNKVKNAGTRALDVLKSAKCGKGVGEQTTEEFWALKDVSFEIKQGDRVGIIGRNGAGKSTLLKILSRITEPTKGRISIDGRVASLLEVGTGFHTELSGRENIYLNGAILGMSREEIKRKFDEIVAFAEVEKFLDTPVKRYSSGMYVRLAFAVAAHLEPEILIVDEVLAVGDAQFQKKCLGRMEEAGKEGRTVLFVSHNLESIKFLCTRGILLHKGEIALADDIEHVAHQYETSILNMFLSTKHSNSIYYNENVNQDNFDIIELTLSNLANEPIASVKTFESFRLDVRFFSPEECESKTVTIVFTTLSGVILLRCAMEPYTSFRMAIKKGINDVACVIEKLPLPAGTYLLAFGICDSRTGEWFLDRQCSLFEVGMSDVYNCGYPPVERHAAVVTEYHWESK